MDEQKAPRFKLASHLSNVENYFNKDSPPVQHHLYFYDLNLSDRNFKQNFQTLSQEIVKFSTCGRNICVINDRLEDHYRIITNGLSLFVFPQYEIAKLEIQSLNLEKKSSGSRPEPKQTDKIVSGRLVHTKLTSKLRTLINTLSVQCEALTDINSSKVEKLLTKIKSCYGHLNLDDFINKLLKGLDGLKLQEVILGLEAIESSMLYKPLFTNLLFITTAQSTCESIKTVWKIKPVTVLINRTELKFQFYTDGSVRNGLGSIGAVQTLDTGHITYLFGYYLVKPTFNITLVELTAILLAISKVRKSKSDHLFCTDSLASIDIILKILKDQQSSNLVRSYPILRKFLNQLQLGSNFRIKYVKGHSDNLGNQLADKLATYAHTMGKPLDIEEWLTKTLAKF